MTHHFKLYLITGEAMRPDDKLALRVDAALEGGADAVQFREKSAPLRQCAAAFTAISRVCRARNVPLFLNAWLAGKFQIGAPFDGIHCGIDNLPADFRIAFKKCLVGGKHGALSIHDAWRRALISSGVHVPSALVIGYSAHEISEARIALECGADFVTMSPVYPTPSKQGILEARGPEWIRKARTSLAGARIIALGGISVENAADVMRAGASGIAVIRAIMAAPDPSEAARRLNDCVNNPPAS
ncbi:MAG: thiamine phosphate synthase [Candidatus Sumerlaeota bacterium]|nr:thiamine phosphate synthase [Candidatus Sumerlaeota bacterium]